jgi:hypothetical protein
VTYKNIIFSSKLSNEPSDTAITEALFDFSTAIFNNFPVTLPLTETAVTEKFLAAMQHSLCNMQICKYANMQIFVVGQDATRYRNIFCMARHNYGFYAINGNDGYAAWKANLAHHQ